MAYRNTIREKEYKQKYFQEKVKGKRKPTLGYINSYTRGNIKRKLKFFGVDEATYNKMLLDQNNVCAICANPETLVNKKTGILRELSIDHDHKTGQIRGLLCSTCNLGLGKFKDNIEVLQNATNYLKKYKI